MAAKRSSVVRGRTGVTISSTASLIVLMPDVLSELESNAAPTAHTQTNTQLTSQSGKKQ